MTGSADNPDQEPVNQFYKQDETAEAEPIKPTDDAVVAEVVDQELPDGTENLDGPKESESDKDKDSAEGLGAADEEENVQYLELDGEEHNLDDVRMWKNGHMMQSDYTKKTTALAEERTTFEAERDTDRENLVKTQSEVSDMRDQLVVLVSEDEEVDWVELKANEPEEYIELKEKADKRKAALEKVKAERLTPVDDPAYLQAEREKFWKANPDWLDEDGKVTEVHKKDSELMGAYVVKHGFDKEEFSKMSQSNILIALLKAAKYDKLQEKGRKIKAEREKVPVVTKPKANASGSEQQTAESIMYAPQEAAG